MTFTRGRAVVAELRAAEWLSWLEQQATFGRQEYMDPEQAAAFTEFLARQPRSASSDGRGPGGLGGGDCRQALP